MSNGIRARIARMWMRKNKNCKTMMDQRRMSRTDATVLDSAKFGRYIADM